MIKYQSQLIADSSSLILLQWILLQQLEDHLKQNKKKDRKEISTQKALPVVILRFKKVSAAGQYSFRVGQ